MPFTGMASKIVDSEVMLLVPVSHCAGHRTVSILIKLSEAVSPTVFSMQVHTAVVTPY